VNKLPYVSQLVIIVILFLSSNIFGQTTDVQENPFLDGIFGYDCSRYCYFLVLNVDSDSFVGKVAIESGNLFLFVKKTKGFDRKGYVKYVKDLITNGKTLFLENTMTDEHDIFLQIKNTSIGKFLLVYDNRQMDQDFSGNCIEFVTRYFLPENNGSTDVDNLTCRQFIKNHKHILRLNQPLGLKKEAVVISKLFDWEIPVRKEHLSNRLIIDKQRVKSKKVKVKNKKAGN